MSGCTQAQNWHLTTSPTTLEQASQVLGGGGFITEGLTDGGGGGCRVARREREKPYVSRTEGHKLDAKGLNGEEEQRRGRAAPQRRGRAHRDGMKGRASTTRRLPPAAFSSSRSGASMERAVVEPYSVPSAQPCTRS
jgi:hypothetical protein